VALGSEVAGFTAQCGYFQPSKSLLQPDDGAMTSDRTIIAGTLISSYSIVLLRRSLRKGWFYQRGDKRELIGVISLFSSGSALRQPASLGFLIWRCSHEASS
jgi:hypothetical protein